MHEGSGGAHCGMSGLLDEPSSSSHVSLDDLLSLPLARSQIDDKYLQQHGRHPPMSNAAIYGCPISFRADSYASALALERLFSTWTRARRLIGC
jgi:hypothetical protein